MLRVNITFFNVLHRYKVTLDAENIYKDPVLLKERLFSDIQKQDLEQYIDSEEENTVNLEYITYTDMVFNNLENISVSIIHNMLPKRVVEYFTANNDRFMIKNYLVVDGYKEPLLIKDLTAVMRGYEEVLDYSYTVTRNRCIDGSTLDNVREEHMKKISDSNLSMKDKAFEVAIIGNTYDLTEAIIDNNKEDLSEKITEEIKSTREEYENTEDPENEWELVNRQVEALLKDDKDIEIKKCTYNGEEIEYNDLVERLMSHVFPQFITQIDIRDTLDDNYIIETDKCKIIRSIGGQIRVEKV